MFSLALLLVLATDSDIASPPVPLTDPSTWVTSDDYPYEAMLLELEGTSSIQWLIDKEGIPSKCTVVQSSGTPVLDQAACNAVLTRARFQPALDSRGKPIAFIKKEKIGWRLPQAGEPITPTIGAGTLVLRFVGEEDGTITGCTATINGKALSSPDFCNNEIRGRKMIPKLDKNGSPVRQKMKLTIALEPDETDSPSP